jgi:hypothetical protein
MAYHRLVRELLDLLDRARCPLLESDAVQSLVEMDLPEDQKSQHAAFMSKASLPTLSHFHAPAFAFEGQPTVYSRATTSAMADRCALPEVFLGAIVGGVETSRFPA